MNLRSHDGLRLTCMTGPKEVGKEWSFGIRNPTQIGARVPAPGGRTVDHLFHPTARTGKMVSGDCALLG